MPFFVRITALAAAAAAAAAASITSAAPVGMSLENEYFPDRYIVQLKAGTDTTSIAAHHNKVRSIHARNLARREDKDGPVGALVDRVYSFGDFKAYSGTFDNTTVEELKTLPEVVTVERDFVMRSSYYVTQSSAPWGLASMSAPWGQREDSYVYDASAVKDTFSYVIDGGVRITHDDFEGRAYRGSNIIGGSSDDHVGHGTEVSSIIGGAKYGVAKKTTIVAVKVMDDYTGYTSKIIAGFQWAVGDIVAKGRQNTAVINMSIGGPGQRVWDAAIAAAWKQGVLVVVAAGNDDTFAHNTSPCRAPETICVGNVEVHRNGGTNYARAPSSNYGDAIDIFAPGTNIRCASHLSDWGETKVSGTSVSAPHVVGLVSYLRALEGPLTAADVKARVLALGARDIIRDSMGSVNLLAQNGFYSDPRRRFPWEW